jgi:hypothetical protein
MRRPPTVKGEIKRLTTKAYFSGSYGEVSLPEVMGSTWVSPGGAEAVAFANCAERPVPLAFKLDLPSWLAGRVFTRVSGDPQIEAIRPGPDGWCTVALPPRSVFVFAAARPDNHGTGHVP